MFGVLAVLAAMQCSAHWTNLHQGRPRTHADTLALVAERRGTGDRCARLVSSYLRALTTSAFTPADERYEIDTTLQSLYPSNSEDPRLRVALAFIRLRQGALSTAARLFNWAQDHAESGVPTLDNHERAVIAYGLGRASQAEWRDWRSFGQLMGITQGQWDCPNLDQEIDMNLRRGAGAVAAATQGLFPSIVLFNVACPELFERLVDDDFRPLSDLKRDARRDLERYYNQALQLDPEFWAAARALASELLYEGSWSALQALGRRLVEQFPRGGEAFAIAAVAERELGHDSLAWSLFQVALTLHPDSLRRLYRSPELVLRLSEQRVFAEQPPAMRQELGAAYWRSRQVTFLADRNERLLEHFARFTTADFVFADPDGMRPGWDTNVGDVWIRYGRPLKIRELAIRDGRGSFWSYGPNPDFVFTRFLTYQTYVVHEEAAAALRQAREEQPTRFMPAGIDAVQPLDRQIVRFRRPDGLGELLVLAPHPRREPATSLEEGVTLLGPGFQPVARWRGPAAGDGLRVTLAALRPGSYSLATEALDRTNRLIFQGRDTVTIARPDADLSLSDIVLVKRVDGPNQVASRSELNVDWVFGTTVDPGSPIGLFWEIYRGNDTTAEGEYRVVFEIRDATERSVLTRILRSVGRGFRHDQPTTRIEYSRVAGPAQTVVEWLNVFGEFASGHSYDVQVTVTAVQTGQTASIVRRFTVR